MAKVIRRDPYPGELFLGGRGILVPIRFRNQEDKTMGFTYLGSAKEDDPIYKEGIQMFTPIGRPAPQPAKQPEPPEEESHGQGIDDKTSRTGDKFLRGGEGDTDSIQTEADR